MKILIIGYGHLGKIYAATLLAQGTTTAQNLYILCKNRQQAEIVLTNGHGQPVMAAATQSVKPDILLLSVKPQDACHIYGTAKKHLAKQTLVVSVMAGITISTIQGQLDHPVVARAMPNSPIAIGRGVTGYCLSHQCNENCLEKVQLFFAGTGLCLCFENEQMLNAVTALSGSGPAYVFYFIESLMSAGTQMGFSETEAEQMATQTIDGALQLFSQSKKTPAQLIAEVSSKGGTTEAAFSVFRERKIAEGITEGIQKARKRAGELSVFGQSENKKPQHC